MKSIIECYPELKEEKDYICIGNYQPILELFGYEILLQVDDNDYQGDSRVLYKDENRFGYLVFGWGSCCGCDALQACESIEEIEGLQDELYNKVKWFENSDECLKYFNEKDWELEYCWHDEETKEFIEK